ncbi:MAG: nitroreductase family protein [Anaerolineales bacterium]
MEFFQVVERRRSIRLFEQRPIEPDKVQRILGTIQSAPSAGNLQSYEVYLVRGAQERASLVRAAGDQDFLARAPLVLVFCAHAGRAATKYGARGTELYCVQDATIACTFAMLAATALELSSVWVGAFNEEAVKQIIGAPRDQHPVAILPIGYPAETPSLRERRPLTDAVHEV